MASNYENVCQNWREQFTTWNHRAQMENLGYRTYDQDHIFLTYLTESYEIDRKTGEISNLSSPKSPISFSVQMALYHILYYPKANPKTSGIWVPFRDVPRAGPFEAAFLRTISQPFAQFFNGKVAELEQIVTELGFPLLFHGDLSFLVELFPNLHLKFIFWDGDEEFPPQVNILFDQNIIDFTHEETVVMMAGDACDCLMQKSVTYDN